MTARKADKNKGEFGLGDRGAGKPGGGARTYVRANRRLFAAGVIALPLCAGLPATAAPAADDEQATVALRIAGQPLSSALLELGRQAGISIALPPDFPRDLMSEPLVGSFTAREALTLLLRDAHAGFTFVDPETVKVGLPVQPQISPPRTIPVTAPAPAPDSTPLEEVVVTARRREERLQAIPVSVTAFSAAQLVERNITSSQDLGLFVPSLVLNNNAGVAPGFVLRGQGLTLSAGPGVVAYFAEVPFPSGQNATSAFQGGTGPGTFFDLENLQVLKGPQGTLFGRNTTGGAILFTPQKPRNDYDGYIDLTLGDYDWHEVEGALNVPVVRDKLLLRVAADVSMRDGYTKDVGPYFAGQDYDNRDYWAFRASAIFRPTDDFENYLILTSLYLHETGTGGSIIAVKPGGLAVEAFPAIEAYLATQQTLGPRETELSSAQIDKQWTYGLVDIARDDIGDDLTLKNIAGYMVEKNSTGIIDVDNGPFAIQDTFAPKGWSGASVQYSDELQLSGKSRDGALQWTAGGYLEYDKPTDMPEYGVSIPILTPSGSYRQDMIVAEGGTTQRTQALYGQATYDLGNLAPDLAGLKFTAGYRYTWDYRSDVSDIYSQTTGTCVERTDAMIPNCELGKAGRFHAPTWTLGLDYQLSPETLLYVTGRRGYKSGGFNLNTPEHSIYSTFQPELVTDVEIGVKSDWTLFGVRGRTDIDMFHTDYTNIQRAISVLINGLSSPVTENAAVATIQGVEFEGTFIPLPNTEIALAYSYLSSKYDRYHSPVLGDLSGLAFPFAPKNKASIVGRYRLPISPAWGDVSLGATYLLQSSVNAGSDFSVTNIIPGYGLINLRLDWKGIGGSDVDAALFVTNAADTVYKTRVSALYNIFGVAGASYGEPRIFGVQLRYRFGP
jgi:iron complex outermembrane receptor protein